MMRPVGRKKIHNVFVNGKPMAVLPSSIVSPLTTSKSRSKVHTETGPIPKQKSNAKSGKQTIQITPMKKPSVVERKKPPNLKPEPRSTALKTDTKNDMIQTVTTGSSKAKAVRNVKLKKETGDLASVKDSSSVPLRRTSSSKSRPRESVAVKADAAKKKTHMSQGCRPKEPPDSVQKVQSARCDSPKRYTPILPSGTDDLDRMLCHEDFSHLVALCEKVKKAQKMRDESPLAAARYQGRQVAGSRSELEPEEVVAAVEKLRETLSIQGAVIRRGTFPLTDAMIDENLRILQSELDLCEYSTKWPSHFRAITSPLLKKRCAYVATPHQAANPSHLGCTHLVPPIQFAKWQTDILVHFLVNHHGHPYLQTDHTRELAVRTGLSCANVLMWFKNARHRHQKEIVDGKRNASTFLDYLFLAEDRDHKKGILQSPLPSEVRPPRPHSSTVQATKYSSKPKGNDYTSPEVLRTSVLSLKSKETEGSHGFRTPVRSSKRKKTEGTCTDEKPSKKLKTVSESFDDENVDPLEFDDLDNDELLLSFADLWDESPISNSVASTSKPTSKFQTPEATCAKRPSSPGLLEDGFDDWFLKKAESVEAPSRSCMKRRKDWRELDFSPFRGFD